MFISKFTIIYTAPSYLHNFLQARQISKHRKCYSLGLFSFNFHWEYSQNRIWFGKNSRLTWIFQLWDVARMAQYRSDNAIVNLSFHRSQNQNMILIWFFINTLASFSSIDNRWKIDLETVAMFPFDRICLIYCFLILSLCLQLIFLLAN